MKKLKSSRMSVAEKMPPLYHTLHGKCFAVESSDVIKWLLQQPDVLQYLFDKARPYLKFNPDTGKWKGVDYEP